MRLQTSSPLVENVYRLLWWRHHSAGSKKQNQKTIMECVGEHRSRSKLCLHLKKISENKKNFKTQRSYKKKQILPCGKLLVNFPNNSAHLGVKEVPTRSRVESVARQISKNNGFVIIVGVSVILFLVLSPLCKLTTSPVHHPQGQTGVE